MTAWPRLAGLAAFIVLALIGGAFLEFAGRLRAGPTDDALHADGLPRADGVAALTGGTDRLDAAMRLMAAGCCQRLLISGVNTETPREDLRRRFEDAAAIFDCCVDIDRAALDTAGNAIETARWARARGFRSLVVVTGAYHMPRSLLLLSEAGPDLVLIPHAVSPERLRLGSWWSRPATTRLVLSEFTKYGISLIRHRLGLGLAPVPLANPLDETAPERAGHGP